jgi:agmatine deiminase
MITDQNTDFLYLADCLPTRYASFFARFEKVLKACNVAYAILPGTKDIWAIDYMPVQVEKNRFIQFVYNPDYLRNDKPGRESISPTREICEAIGLPTIHENLVLDGGNVIRASDKAILTDKVWKENPGLSKDAIHLALKNCFGVETIIIIPKDPYDFTGHADGMVRFYREDTVLINDYSKEKSLQRRLHQALKEAGLQVIPLPYHPYGNKSNDMANGIYINFLQMKEVVIVPTYGLKEDEQVIQQIKELFPRQRVIGVDCQEIAREGGVLNCISWNIVNPF